VKAEETRPASALQAWRPFENMRREIDRLFDDFDRKIIISRNDISVSSNVLSAYRTVSTLKRLMQTSRSAFSQ
jgi:hypothetical protein